jgi:hypothetical protein
MPPDMAVAVMLLLGEVENPSVFMLLDCTFFNSLMNCCVFLLFSLSLLSSSA